MENIPLGETNLEFRKRVGKEKRLHGKFFNDVNDVADERLWQ